MPPLTLSKANVLVSAIVMINVLGVLLSCLGQGNLTDELIFPDGCSHTQYPNPIWSPQTPVSPLSSGWILNPAFSDEFETNQLNESKWYVVDNGCHSMSKKAIFLKNSNTYSVDGHRLLLKQYRLPQPDTCPFSGEVRSFASAYITAHAKVRYGYYEIRSKYPPNVNLSPCFWFQGAEGNPIKRYDEIDAMEYDVDRISHNRLRNNILHGYDQPDTSANLPAQLECKPILSTTSFIQDTLVIGVEWLPREINFYLNRECIARYKHSSDSNVHVRNFENAFSDFTCVNINDAIPQLMMLSFSVNIYDSTSFDSIQDGQRWAIDWVRSYKLIEASQPNSLFWPPYVSLTDPELLKVHKEIYLGGDDNHSGLIPISNNLTLWSKTNISLGSSFVVQPGSSITLRCIQTSPDVFSTNSQQEE